MSPDKKGAPLNPEEFLAMLNKNNIYFSDGGNTLEKIKEWLTNEYSGYPDIAKKIITLLHEQKVGAAVPIDNISGKYGYSVQHDMERLKAAYIAAWREKNGF
jgi:hypothetical protein